ncbi:hypothetical protein [Arsenicicoccus piscis]|uniref:Uncharacterized protein n=1 Tax=Arsenicicoccus piscis TaxID=673954 RepID=A0ABQ6HSV3_9MICO|nr:hypothetical protein [Arsenicicoccus piscis]GMA21581.1 hypothetical protein GCM10025862_36020 [Arsenicicoccus piscis]
MDFLNTLLSPIEFVVAWIMYGWHQAFTAIGMDPEEVSPGACPSSASCASSAR